MLGQLLAVPFCCDGGVLPWVEVALEEYKTLRQESLAAIEQIQRTLQIGLVAIGVITGFGVEATAGSSESDTDIAVSVGLVCGPPLLAALVAVMCLEELRRVVAAGVHVADLERRIAARMGEGDAAPLTWETGIQCQHARRHGYAGHWWRTAALFGAAVPVMALGMVALSENEDHSWLWLAGAFALLLIVATVLFQGWRHHGLEKQARAAMDPPDHGPAVTHSRSDKPNKGSGLG